MNTCINQSGCINIFVGNKKIQQWYMLSADVDERMKWFDELVGIDDNDFN